MTCKLLGLLAATLLAAPAAAGAQPDPTSEEVKKVVEYFNAGKDKGPVLSQLKPCLTIDTKKGSPTLWECTEPATGKVKKGSVVYAWTEWLVPKEGKYEDLTLQWLLEGTVRTTQDLSLTAAGVGLRTYKGTAVTKAGKWEIKVLRDNKELASAKFEVE